MRNPFSMEALTGKLGPLPVYAWAGIGGVGLALLVFVGKRKGGATPIGEVTLQPGPNAVNLGGEFGYGGAFDPGAVGGGGTGASAGGTAPSGGPTSAVGGATGVGSGGQAEPMATDPQPSPTSVETAASEPIAYEPQMVTAGGWTGLVAEQGIPLSAGIPTVEAIGLDLSYAAGEALHKSLFPALHEAPVVPPTEPINYGEQHVGTGGIRTVAM